MDRGPTTLRAEDQMKGQWGVNVWVDELKMYPKIYTQYIEDPFYPGSMVPLGYNHTLPLDYNRRARWEFRDMPQVREGLVFRALRMDEHPEAGLEAKLPLEYGKVHYNYVDGAALIPEQTPRLPEVDHCICFHTSFQDMPVEDHVKFGSRMVHSKYISTSWCPIAALFYAMKACVLLHRDPQLLRIVAIILGPEGGLGGVREHAYIYDMAKPETCPWQLRDSQALNYVKAFEEVILEGLVPSQAIERQVSMAQIFSACEPREIQHLTDEVFHGISDFREACAGHIENYLRSLFGMPTFASIRPERALHQLNSRVILAKHIQACQICHGLIGKGDRITKSPVGWAHATCGGVPNAPVSQPTRRGGMSARIRARDAARERSALLAATDMLSIPGTNDSWF
mmetsp:Transcript_99649/g.181787  ORF Transcript_99649/g.181787 Transcript_99649/m.181787 type:complete len:398 (+) Transcript_99649:98-1291(+)